MRRCFVIIFIVLSLAPQSLFAWGKRGHDVISYIAECHLSDEALARVTEILDGKSMVYYANWMDSASHTRRYDYTKTWHYFNIERGESPKDVKRVKRGDVISAMESIVAELKSGELDAESESVALKMLIHLVGDMHQPMHLGRESDEGGNLIPVVYFVESTSLHALWDYHIVEGVHSWSYSEWQYQIDRLTDIEEAKVVSGDYWEWLEATHSITKQIYRDTPIESRIFYEYIDKYRPVVEQQLLYAGLRLAYIINSIY